MLAKKSAVTKTVIHTPKYLSWDLPLNPATLGVWYIANGAMSVCFYGSCTHNQSKVNNIFLALLDFWKHWNDCKKQYYGVTLAGYCYQNRYGGQVVNPLTFLNGFANKYKHTVARLQKSQLTTYPFKAEKKAWPRALPAFGFNMVDNQYDACLRKKISCTLINFTQKPTVC